MGRSGLNITVLTSSRADYSFYLPLLKKMQSDSYFKLTIIAFGTHLSKKHGYTITAILKDGFKPQYRIKTVPEKDSSEEISISIGNTIKNFAGIWKKEKNNTDLIIALGDRFEMFAAVSASVPFNIPVAHLSGGDTTLGAIDNIFRHSMTIMSKVHFTSIKSSTKAVIRMTGSPNVYTVGSLSLDNLNKIRLLTKKEFQKTFKIELKEHVLVTFHPETVSYERNKFYISELINALEQIKDQIIVTLPNADTGSDHIRAKFHSFANGRKNVFLVESLGTLGYYTCLNNCKYLIGNSSSGIVEAASFGKYVINIGDRQKGRAAGKNVIHIPITTKEILRACNSIVKLPVLDKKNMYGDGKASLRIIEILKKWNN